MENTIRIKKIPAHVIIVTAIQMLIERMVYLIYLFPKWRIRGLHDMKTTPNTIDFGGIMR
jgi:hypothetical protein